MGAKQIVATGMRWRIGDGRAVNICEYRWILNDIGGKAISHRPTKCNLTKVHELIYYQRNYWKRQLEKHVF